MKVIYLRVSTKDLDESTQLPEILRAFDLKPSDCLILSERVSAYDDSKQEDRAKFIELKNMIEKGEVSDVYVYSLERFERNIQRMLEFFFFCEGRGCKLNSALQPYLNNMFPKAIDNALAKNPIYLFIKYMMALIYGFVAQNESFFISQRTSKAVIKGKITTSYKGNKWGSKYRDLNGNRIDLPIKTIEALRRRVKFLLIEKKMRGNDIVKDIEKNFKVKISLMSISNIKNGKTE
jgi:DNA invertase Pin-like site-specific DNA recombinase